MEKTVKNRHVVTLLVDFCPFSTFGGLLSSIPVKFIAELFKTIVLKI